MRLLVTSVVLGALLVGQGAGAAVCPTLTDKQVIRYYMKKYIAAHPAPEEPTPPDNGSTLQERGNYLVDHKKWNQEFSKWNADNEAKLQDTLYHVAELRAKMTEAQCQYQLDADAKRQAAQMGG